MVENKPRTFNAADKTRILEVRDVNVSPDANRIAFSVDVAKGDRFGLPLDEVPKRRYAPAGEDKVVACSFSPGSVR